MNLRGLRRFLRWEFLRFFPALLAICCLEAMAGNIAPGAPEIVRVGGTGSGTLLLQHMAQAYVRQQPGTQIKAVLPPLGGNGGLRALSAAAIDLAIVSSPPRRASGEDAPAGGSLLWVKTPLAMVARNGAGGNGSSNPGLSRDQVADIFSGRLAQWPDGRPIRLVLRSQRESDLKLLRAISPEIDAAVGLALKRTGIPVAENDVENRQILERTPGSFGIVPLGQLMLPENQPTELVPLPIDGVMPSTAALRSRAYPYEKPFYLAFGKAPSAATRDFLAFLQSPAALEILARLGFVPAQ